jgi:hypothetical protein
MPDGTRFFSATRASNRFDVDDWNVCKRLPSHWHRTLSHTEITHWSPAPDRLPAV